MRDTKMDILRHTDYQFLQSGFLNRTEFYPAHLNYINIWCEHWHISTNSIEKSYEEELRTVRDWSREYWH